MTDPGQRTAGQESPSTSSGDRPGRPTRHRGSSDGRVGPGHDARVGGHDERDSGRAERDSGHDERDSGRAERDSGHDERDGGRAERDSGHDERDSGRAERDIGRAVRPTDPTAVMRLLTWLSPGFPTGAYAYSHGLEWAVETHDIRDGETLSQWLNDVIEHGSARTDTILLRHAHRAANDPVSLRDVAALALATAAGRERYDEALAQGRAFLLAASGWGVPDLPHDTPYAVAAGAMAGVHGIDEDTTAGAFLQTIATNFISAAVRLVPLGQTTGLQTLAALEPVILLAKATIPGHLLFVVEDAQRPLADDLTDQTGLLERFLACSLRRFAALHRPPLWDDPPVRLTRGQQHHFAPAAGADAPGQRCKLHVTGLASHTALYHDLVGSIQTRLAPTLPVTSASFRATTCM